MPSHLAMTAERSRRLPQQIARRGRIRRRILAGAVLLLLAAGITALVALRVRPKTLVPSAAVLTVSVVPVERIPMAETLLVNGSLTPWEDLSIGAEASGLAIMQVRVEEGDWVTAGQPLAKLDDALLQAQLQETDAQIAKSAALLEIGENDVKRARELLKTSAISVQAAEQRQATARAAQADLALARAQRAALVAQIDRTEIRAPAAGLISKRIARLGRVVSSGEELFREVRDGILELDAEVPDRLLARCQPGQVVRVRRDDGSVILGRVRLVAPLVDTSSRNGIVHVRFAANDWLKAGMFVSGELILGEAPTLAVPESAVLVKDGHALVFLLTSGGKAVLRPIETAQRADGKVAIRAGVAEGDRVVTTGAGFLRDGDVVRVAGTDAG